MPVDFQSQDISTGSVTTPMFSSHESGNAASEGVSGRVASLDAATVRGSARGPAELFSYRVLKRWLDIFLVVLFSPIFVLVLLAIAAAVRISSPGPVFFSHRRIRGHGVFFTMWKFRTMCVNSTEVLENHLAANPEARLEWHAFHKLKNDPRVTRVGAFLRRSSLDEFPQLWNVLNGTMSLVGPRPIVADEVKKFGDAFAAYCKVKPGITGLWQVSGRSSTTYDERIQLDSSYANEWSFPRDLVILLKTLVIVVKQHGAY